MRQLFILLIGFLMLGHAQAQVRGRSNNTVVLPPILGDEKPGPPAPVWALGQADAMYLEEDNTLEVSVLNLFLLRTDKDNINLGLSYEITGLKLVAPESVEVTITTMLDRRLFIPQATLVFEHDGLSSKPEVVEIVNTGCPTAARPRSQSSACLGRRLSRWPRPKR